MRIRNLEQALEELKLHLPEYLDSHGRTPNRQKRFQCPNEGAHRNGDRNPSAAFVPGTNQTVWHCFACDERGTILHAAYWLENLPIQGAGFAQTVMDLCHEYRIDVVEDVDAQRLHSAFEHGITTLTRGREARKVQDYVQERGLDGVAETFEFGYANVDKLSKILEQTLDEDMLARSGLTRKDLMHDRLVFPIRDADGNPVAFASRKIDLSDERPKYLNSAASALYDKSKTLYHLHAIRGDSAWVVEGYADVWTLTAHGVPAVAIAGTAFTRHHMDLLIERGVRKITVALDGDFAGQEAMRKVLPMLEAQNDLRVWYVILPGTAQDKDPDAYVNQHGIDAFLALPTQEIASQQQRLLTTTKTRIEAWNDRCWEGVQRGYEMPKWPYLTEQMNGWQRGMYLLSARSNVGKTHVLRAFAENLLRDNADLYVIFFSLDDTVERTIARFVAANAYLPINTVNDPERAIVERLAGDVERQAAVMEQRERGYQSALGLSDRLILRGGEDGASVEQVEKTIATVRELTGSPLVAVIDSVNKLRTETRHPNDYERDAYIGRELKRITNAHELLLIGTMEFHKVDSRGEPDTSDMRGGALWEYESDAVFLLYNELDAKGEDAKLVHEYRGAKLPVIQLEVRKNKLSEFKGRSYFRLYPNQSRVEECNEHDRNRYLNLRSVGKG